MITSVIKTNSFNTETAVNQLMVPRLNEEDKLIPGAKEEYLHWMSLLLLMRDANPDLCVIPELISSTEAEVIMKVSIWTSPAAERPIAVAYCEERRTDQIGDTLKTCQSKALRQALLHAGSGLNLVLEDEIARRKAKLDEDEKEAETLRKENAPISAREMYEALKPRAKKAPEPAMEEKAPAPEEVVVEPEPSVVESVNPESDVPEEINDPFLQAGVKPPTVEDVSPQVEEKPEDADGESAPEKAPVPVTEPEPEPLEPETDAVEATTSGSEEDEVDYLIKEGDFKKASYDRRYAGKRLSELEAADKSMLPVIRDNPDVITDEFKSKIDRFLSR